MIDLDAGCCGMAGSFGYEAEHYEISRLVGEQRLLPAVRQAGPDTVVVAPGFSCRLQIQHFTGHEAVHPAEILRSCLDELPLGKSFIKVGRSLTFTGRRANRGLVDHSAAGQIRQA